MVTHTTITAIARIRFLHPIGFNVGLRKQPPVAEVSKQAARRSFWRSETVHPLNDTTHYSPLCWPE
jgi:hypothetical protein